MGKTFADKVRRMNDDLNRELKKHKPKERITFHRASQKFGESDSRSERRASKQNLRRGDW